MRLGIIDSGGLFHCVEQRLELADLTTSGGCRILCKRLDQMHRRLLADEAARSAYGGGRVTENNGDSRCII